MQVRIYTYVLYFFCVCTSSQTPSSILKQTISAYDILALYTFPMRIINHILAIVCAADAATDAATVAAIEMSVEELNNFYDRNMCFRFSARSRPSITLHITNSRTPKMMHRSSSFFGYYFCGGRLTMELRI